MNNQSSTNKFAQKLRQGEKLVLYELLPPPQNLTKADLHKSFSLFADYFEKYSIDAVNIPEVREEVRNGMRKTTELVKLDPAIVSLYLQRYGVEDIIINKPVVYDVWEEQKKWLSQAYENGIQNFIFVGGESSAISYPGISVSDATKKVTEELRSEFPEVAIGGITIPTRAQEVKRLVKKTQAGTEFFTSQVIYESESVKQLLKSYWEICRLKNIKPQTIFLSFAPIASYSDVELLTWLGVEIPQIIRQELKIGWLGMAERSFKICENILLDVLSYLKENNIQVPVGLNIEHISRRNFELSFILLSRLAKIYRHDYNLATKNLLHD